MKNKIAIVTVVFNSKQDIGKTIESVLRQDYEDFEYIIQDGGSTDGTIQIAEKFKKKFMRKNIRYSIYVEKDEGIYDAMNKAILKIDSVYVLFLNAGDFLAKEDILSNIFTQFRNGFPDIIYGNYYNYYNYYRKKVDALSIENITKRMVCTHQAILTKCDLLKERPYNTEYKMVADYDFYLQMYLNGKIFKKIDIEIVYFEVDGTSQKNARLTQLERLSIMYKYGYISSKKYKFRQIISWYLYLKKMIIRLMPIKIRFGEYELFNSYLQYEN